MCITNVQQFIVKFSYVILKNKIKLGLLEWSNYFFDNTIITPRGEGDLNPKEKVMPVSHKALGGME